MSSRSRRCQLAVTAVALVLLAGCGFDYPTDRVNTIGPGTNDRAGSVDVLGAVVVASQDDVGLFLATLVNNSSDEEAVLTGFDGGSRGQLRSTAPGMETPVAPRGRVTLLETGGIPVAGEFVAGDFVTVELRFDSAPTVRFDVPVVRACDQYSPEALGVRLPGGPPPPDRYADEPTPDRDGEFADTEEGRHPDRYACVVERAELPVHDD